MHFRLRVLDLIETFVKSQPENPLVYASLSSLLALVLFNFLTLSGAMPLWFTYLFVRIRCGRSFKLVDVLYNIAASAVSKADALPMVDRISGLYRNRLCRPKSYDLHFLLVL